MKFEVREALSSQAEYKRKFNFSELYLAYVFVPGAVITSGGNRSKWLSCMLLRAHYDGIAPGYE